MDKRLSLKYILVLITSPEKKAKAIVEHLLRKKLIACGNIVKNVQSLYWWEGKICCDDEVLIILKTKKKFFKKIIKEVKTIHPYKVPEIISLNLYSGNKDYLNWIDEVTK